MRGRFDIVARIAHGQHGRVARRQLLATGVGAKQIDRWVAARLLRPVHDGVYAVGHAAPSTMADYMAAVLAFRDGTVLSHDAAAYVLGLLRGAPPPPEVTVPTTAGVARPGVIVHRVKALHPLDCAELDDLPITILPRVLLDLAPRTQPRDLTRLCHEAWVRHECGPGRIEACIARNPRKPGAARLRSALGADVTLSDLEDAFLVLLARADLPAPRTNIDREGLKVDCHWPELDLTIELVTFRYHATRQAFEADVARRRRSGHVAYTWGDVTERPAETIADLRPRLAA